MIWIPFLIFELHSLLFVVFPVSMHRIVLFNVSNAALRSQSRIPVFSFSPVFLDHSCWVAVRADMVDLPALKPCWLFGRRLFDSICFVNWLHTIFSRIFDVAFRMLIGPVGNWFQNCIRKTAPKIQSFKNNF